MPSRPVSSCIRKGDKDIVIPCCRYTGGPTTQSLIEELLIRYAPEYGVMRGRRELILHSTRMKTAERVKKWDWVVIDGYIPRVMHETEFQLKYLPMHHSVEIQKIKEKERED